jgi:hypothetical protein
MCALGVVFYLDVGIGHNRVARIGHNAGKPATGRGLGDREHRRHKHEAEKNQE